MNYTHRPAIFSKIFESPAGARGVTGEPAEYASADSAGELKASILHVGQCAVLSEIPTRPHVAGMCTLRTDALK